MCFLEKKVEKSRKKFWWSEKRAYLCSPVSGGGVGPGSRDAWASSLEGQESKEKASTKEKRERTSIHPGGASPGPIEMKRGRGRTKQSDN